MALLKCIHAFPFLEEGLEQGYVPNNQPHISKEKKLARERIVVVMQDIRVLDVTVTEESISSYLTSPSLTLEESGSGSFSRSYYKVYTIYKIITNTFTLVCLSFILFVSWLV